MARGRKPGCKKAEGSGRVKGVPNKATRDVKELAQKYAPEAFEALAEIAVNGKTEQGKVAAIKEILDRAYGKSKQYVATEGNDSLQVIIKNYVVAAAGAD